MSDPIEKIYESADSEPDDDLWLDEGRRMIVESLTRVREAANSLMTALGLLQGIYLGILGFAKFIPETLPLWQKVLFIFPLLLWLFALYLCIAVVMTRRLEIYWHSPDDIRKQSTALLIEKQRYLTGAFWLLAVGLLSAFALIVYRLEM